MPVLDVKWLRPALMIFTTSSPTQVGGTGASVGNWNLGSSYIYLTDDGRSSLKVGIERIENKTRMIDGRMRSYFVADKTTYSISWDDLPSRNATDTISEGDSRRRASASAGTSASSWAAGNEMLEWYLSSTGPFYMILIYDRFVSSASFAQTKFAYEVKQVFFEDFSYDVKKRGSQFDLWDVSMSLVEV